MRLGVNTGRSNGRVYRVLVVSCDADRAAAMSATLAGENEAFDVECAASGKEALKSLDRGPAPSAVVIERDLPDVNGFELANRIRKAPGFDGTRTVVVASKGEATSAARGLAEGCDAYVLEANTRARASLAAFAVRLLAA
jgi:CheY-like chemotaxis protein